MRHTDVGFPSSVCEYGLVSLRAERLVKYEIRAQARVDSQWQEFSTSPIVQKFRFAGRTCKSQVSLGLFSSLPFHFRSFLPASRCRGLLTGFTTCGTSRKSLFCFLRIITASNSAKWKSPRMGSWGYGENVTQVTPPDRGHTRSILEMPKGVFPEEGRFGGVYLLPPLLAGCHPSLRLKPMARPTRLHGPHQVFHGSAQASVTFIASPVILYDVRNPRSPVLCGGGSGEGTDAGILEGGSLGLKGSLSCPGWWPRRSTHL